MLSKMILPCCYTWMHDSIQFILAFVGLYCHMLVAYNCCSSMESFVVSGCVH